jgi:hypothetical protein
MNLLKIISQLLPDQVTLIVTLYNFCLQSQSCCFFLSGVPETVRTRVARFFLLQHKRETVINYYKMHKMVIKYTKGP